MQLFKTFITLLLSTIILMDSKAQNHKLPSLDYVPQNPTTAAFSRYGEIPVDLSTGVPSIEIPIYTVNSGKLNIPISLSYHASGIKLRDVSSEIGLGWILNTGGFITRTTLGLEDSMSHYTPLPFKSAAEFELKRSQTTNELQFSNNAYRYGLAFKGAMDYYSDRYYFKLPNGESGVIRQDFQTGEYRTIPYSASKITMKPDGGLNWPIKIVSKDGVIYHFKQTVDLWTLEKIVDNNKQDSIQYYYHYNSYNIPGLSFKYRYPDQINPNFSGESVWSEARIWVPNDNYCGGNLSVDYWAVPRREFIYGNANNVAAPLIDSIVTGSAVVKFTYVSDRIDLYGGGVQARLTDVTVIEKVSRNVIKHLKLDHSYFGNSPQNRRMRLDSVYSVSANEGKYKLKYNSTMLGNYPDVALSNPGYGEDFWGYNNGAGGADLVPEFYSPTQIASVNYFNNINRYPNENAAKAAILEEISYPTGGKTIFDYESNKVSGFEVYEYNATNKPTDGRVGGLRLKSVKSFATSSSQPIVKTYEYAGNPNGGSISPTNYTYNQLVYNMGSSYAGGHWTSTNCYTIRMTSANIAVPTPFVPIIGQQGSPLYYFHVTEYLGDGVNNIGKTVYSYTETGTYHSSPSAELRFSGPFYYDEGAKQPKLAGKDEYNFINGQYQLVKQTVNQYDYKNSVEFQTGFNFDSIIENIEHQNMSPSGDAYSYEGTYYYQNYLASVYYSDTKANTGLETLIQTDVYDYSNPNQFVKATTHYEYDDRVQLVHQYTQSSTSDTFHSSFKYPYNYTGTVYQEMVNRNMIEPVIEQLDYKNVPELPLMASKTDYNFFATNQIYFQTFSTKQGTGNYEPRIQFYSYDNKGNVLSASKTGGSMVGCLWGYNKQYLIAECKNATNQEIYHENFEELAAEVTGIAHTGKKYTTNAIVSWVRPNSREYVISYWYKAGTEWKYSGEQAYHSNTFTMTGSTSSSYDDVRIHPKDALMTTYTYKPLVGMISMTDSKGVTTKYEYDDAQRLWRVRDNSGKITKQYCYNYAGEATNCLVTPSKPVVYAQLEVSNVTQVPNDGSPYTSIDNMDTYADLKIKFYSDPGCSQPYTLEENMDVDMSWAYNYSDQYGQNNGTPFLSRYTALQGFNQLDLGNWQLRSISTYNDPWYGTVVNSWHYDFDLVPLTGSNYQVVSKVGWYYY